MLGTFLLLISCFRLSSQPRSEYQETNRPEAIPENTTMSCPLPEIRETLCWKTVAFDQEHLEYDMVLVCLAWLIHRSGGPGTGHFSH